MTHVVGRDLLSSDGDIGRWRFKLVFVFLLLPRSKLMELMLPSTPKQLSSNGSRYAVASTVLDLGTIEAEVDSTSSCAPDRPRMFLNLLTAYSLMILRSGHMVSLKALLIVVLLNNRK